MHATADFHGNRTIHQNVKGYLIEKYNFVFKWKDDDEGIYKLVLTSNNGKFIGNGWSNSSTT